MTASTRELWDGTTSPGLEGHGRNDAPPLHRFFLNKPRTVPIEPAGGIEESQCAPDML